MKTSIIVHFLWGCGVSSAKLVHQKSKPVMLLSQVISAGNVCHRLDKDICELFKYNQCKSFYACFCDEIFHKNTTQLPLS